VTTGVRVDDGSVEVGVAVVVAAFDEDALRRSCRARRYTRETTGRTSCRILSVLRGALAELVASLRTSRSLPCSMSSDVSNPEAVTGTVVASEVLLIGLFANQ
jgi:hypothetical protein